MLFYLLLFFTSLLLRVYSREILYYTYRVYGRLYVDTYNTIINIKTKIGQFNRVRQHYGLFSTGKMIYKLCAYKIKNSIYGKDDVKFDNGYYTVNYNYEGNDYTVRWKDINYRNKPKIKRIVDQNDNDVTPIITKFIGPSGNFHGINTSPKDLGYIELSFHSIFGNNIKTFKENDIIQL